MTKVSKLANRLILKYATGPGDYYDLGKEIADPGVPMDMESPGLDLEFVQTAVTLRPTMAYVDAILREAKQVSDALENPTLDAKFPAATALEAQRFAEAAWSNLSALKSLLVLDKGKLR